jgi:glycosyltransferase involved in cell wall biosynthesis
MKIDSELPVVDVLLATLNGQEFVAEFLDSLSTQTGVRIHLIVSDDGSNDQTIEIVKNSEKSFYRLTLVNGPRLGATKNFLSLLNVSKSKYIAFADQDDIWSDDKLLSAVGKLEYHDVSTLYTCGVQRSDNGKVHIPQDFPFPLDFLSNNFQGCTFVFNQGLREMILKYSHLDFPHYDWFIFLVAKYLAKVTQDDQAKMMYRIHNNNSVGYFDWRARIENLINPALRQQRRIDIITNLSCLIKAIKGEEKFSIAQNLQQLSKSLLYDKGKFLVGRNNLIAYGKNCGRGLYFFLLFYFQKRSNALARKFGETLD